MMGVKWHCCEWSVSTILHHIVTTAWFYSQANLEVFFFWFLLLFLYLGSTFLSYETTDKALITLMLSFHNGK